MAQKAKIELGLVDDRLKAQLAQRAAKGLASVEKFLHDVVTGKLKERAVVDVWKTDPKTGELVRAREIQQIEPCVKDRVAAAKAWKELCVDKRAADKKEGGGGKTGDAPPTTGSLTDAVKRIGERKQKEALKLLQGGAK